MDVTKLEKPLKTLIGNKLTIRRSSYILLAILFLGLFLRIYDLGTESLWGDEGFSILIANLDLLQVIKGTAEEPHLPLYYVILHYWINLFGDTEFSTRFLSVIFGFIAIFMIYKVGTLIFNKNVGVLSSLLLALSVFHIHYSQEVRMYSLMALLTLFSIYFFVKLLDRTSFAVSIGYIISSALLMYSHVFGLFIIIAQNIYFLTLFLSKEEYKLNFRRWILFQIILVILYMPWIVFLINNILEMQSGFWIPVPTLYYLIKTFRDYSGRFLLLLLYLILPFFSIVLYEKIKGKINWKDFLKSIGSYFRNLRLSDVNKIYLLLLWLLIPTILPFIISQFSTPIYVIRYTIAASLAFYILIAKGIDNISNKPIKISIIILIILLSLGEVVEYHTEVDKQQWREVASYIDMNAEPGDLLLFDFEHNKEWVFDYYSKRTDLEKRVLTGKKGDIDEENIKELGPTVNGYNRVWVILCRSYDWEADKKREKLIKKALNYNLSYNQKYYGIDVSLFIKNE